MTVVLILFIALLFWLWVYKESNKKQPFPTKKGVWYYQKGNWPWEENKRVTSPETIGWTAYATARLNGIDHDIQKSFPTGRLRMQFISACWKLHRELHPDKHVGNWSMSLRLRRAIRNGKGWRYAVLQPANNRGQFTNNK